MTDEKLKANVELMKRSLQSSLFDGEVGLKIDNEVQSAKITLGLQRGAPRDTVEARVKLLIRSHLFNVELLGVAFLGCGIDQFVMAIIIRAGITRAQFYKVREHVQGIDARALVVYKLVI